MSDKLEDTLNGGFAGLYGEVVVADSYKIRDINFVPDAVIDLGANVGVFTRFAKELFPNAFIYAVEPDAENFSNLVKFTDPINVTFINKGIGKGILKRRKDEGANINGSHVSFVSEDSVEDKIYDTDQTAVESVMLHEIFKFIEYNAKVLIKIDVEGAEFCIFEDDASMHCLQRTEYFVIELHHKNDDFSDEQKLDKVKSLEAFIKAIQETHTIIYDHPLLFATKK